MTIDLVNGVAGGQRYRGDCGAVLVVAIGCPDDGRPRMCSCGAELYPQVTPAPAVDRKATVVEASARSVGGARG